MEGRLSRSLDPDGCTFFDQSIQTLSDRGREANHDTPRSIIGVTQIDFLGKWVVAAQSEDLGCLRSQSLLIRFHECLGSHQALNQRDSVSDGCLDTGAHIHRVTDGSVAP